ncbi:DUF6445 family protein [Gilvimarinus japonicus]|uniref:DUF6445 family protein n=1 Tax=Gilvimarinus japonicus TaxID=1796469 RepID=A0ABV7HYS5_9GAMM
MSHQTPYTLNAESHVEIANFGNENQEVIIIDNFLKNPQALVDFAVQKGDFEQYQGHCNFYPGIRLPAPQEYSREIMPKIKSLLLSTYNGLSADWELNKADCMMSLITIKPENLRKVQSTPHFDSANPYQFAALLYLCNEDHGGTAFFRHNQTGYETIAFEDRKKFEAIYFNDIERAPVKRGYFSDSNEYFTRIGKVDAKFNRMVIYRSCLLHSALVGDKSIDSNPKTGRLTVNSFVAF